MQFFDTINKTRPFEIMLEDPKVLSEYAVIRLGSYGLKQIDDKNKEFPEK